MTRPNLLPYLVPLFGDGKTPPGSDFRDLIMGLGTQTDRPRIQCDVAGIQIPDDLLMTRTVEAAGSDAPVLIADLLCNYYNNGWLAECSAVCTEHPDTKAFYYVGEQVVATNTYTIFSIQFENPGFDRGGFKSESAVRVLCQRYNPATQTIVHTDARLVLTSLSSVLTSNKLKGIQVVYGAAPVVEDWNLYVQLPEPASLSAVIPDQVVVGEPFDFPLEVLVGGYAGKKGILRGMVSLVTGVSVSLVSGETITPVVIESDGSFVLGGDPVVGFMLEDTSFNLRVVLPAGTTTIGFKLINLGTSLTLASLDASVVAE